MEVSLFGPEGYYSTGKADIRKGGDFPTFPAIESFNQSVGNSVVKVWEALGKPWSCIDPVHRIEILQK